MARCSIAGCRERATCRGRGLLPTVDQRDRLYTGARSHRQSHVLSVSHPDMGAWRQAHGNGLLQAGDLHQPLRAEPWLREVKDPTDARAQEFRLRLSAVPNPGCTAACRARLRTGAADRSAAYRRTQLCPSAPHRRDHHSPGPAPCRTGDQRRRPSEDAPSAPTPTLMSENRRHGPDRWRRRRGERLRAPGRLLRIIGWHDCVIQ